MGTARRAARVLVAVSTFLRAPWGVSLAVKSTLNARPRAAVAFRQRSTLHSCTSSTNKRPATTGSATRGAASAGDETAMLSGTADVETGASTADLRGMGVSESEVLSREAWMARAETHRQRCVNALNTPA